MFVCSLNSGSNANCYYIGNQNEAVLIDGGLSCRETVRRMKRVGLSIKTVKAIFVSHEHGDHIHGVPGLSKKFHLPVYLSASTLEHSGVELREDLVRIMRPYDPVRIGDLSIIAFPKLHDAIDPQSFIIEHQRVRVGVFTDIGAPCEHVTKAFRQCHAAFLEANYDENMLLRGSYPYHLKNRIRSQLGHMSNDQALELFVKHRPSHMSHLFLSHLSRDNNSPKLVKNIFERVAGQTHIIIASRDHETKLYHIREQRRYSIPSFRQRRTIATSTQQLSLFQ